jgi:hypothetical protein
MLKHDEIRVLLKAGHSHAEVASLLGISQRSVRRVASAGAAATPSDLAGRRIGRPSLVEEFRTLIADLLQQEPTMKSSEVLRRVTLAGYRGQKSALYALTASLRPQRE